MPYASPLARKLNLKSGMTVHVVGKPDDVALEGLVAGEAAAADGLLLFARDAAEAEAGSSLLVEAALADRVAWIAYPKAGQLGTDLNRDLLWKQMIGRGIQPVRQVAVDDVWSALRFRKQKQP